MRILHVHDAGALATHTSALLKSFVPVVDSVPPMEEASEVLATNCYDLLIFDVDDVDPEEVSELPRLRSEDFLIRVLVCGSTSSISKIAEVMNHGVDDFILRPFRSEELRIRVRQIAVRSSEAARPPVGQSGLFGPLLIDLVRGEITLDGEPVELTPRERSVLQVLVRANGNVVSKDQIASRVYALNEDADPKAIETYVHLLRRKIKHPVLQIDTVRGLGYRLRLLGAK